MRTPALTLLVAAAVSVVVGLVTDDGWPGYVIGAVLALALWVMLFAGLSAARGAVSSRVPVVTYAVAAAVAVAAGAAFFLLAGGDNGSWWAVGFILAGVGAPVASRASSDG